MCLVVDKDRCGNRLCNLLTWMSLFCGQRWSRPLSRLLQQFWIIGLYSRLFAWLFGLLDMYLWKLSSSIGASCLMIILDYDPDVHYCYYPRWCHLLTQMWYDEPTGGGPPSGMLGKNPQKGPSPPDTNHPAREKRAADVPETTPSTRSSPIASPNPHKTNTNCGKNIG